MIVLSDHGFGALTHAVYLNLYFSQQGILAYREPRAAAGNSVASALRAGVKRLNNPLVGAVKQKVFEIAPQLKSSLHYSMAYGSIDWSRTRAYAVGTMGNVYLNVRGREPQGIVEPGEYDTVRAEVIAAMRALRDPETQKPIFDNVYRREEIYHGGALEHAPDVVGLIDGPYHVAAVDWRAGGVAKTIVEKVGKQLLFVSDTSGQHRMDGILVLHGAGILQNASPIEPPNHDASSRYAIHNPASTQRREDASQTTQPPNHRTTQRPNLTDLAPTILQLLGEPIPDDMDGRVLDEFLANERTVEYAPAVAFDNTLDGEYSADEARAVEERLAGLGYLG